MEKHPEGSFTLVLGVDASGKSTFLKNLAQNFDFKTVEVSSNREAQSFKVHNRSTPIEEAFVDRREMIYRSLSKKYADQTRKMTQSGINVASSGFELTALISHSIMRTIVTGKEAKNWKCVNHAVNKWLTSDECKPDIITHLYASEKIIQQRIIARQEAGWKEENFWGFNAPHFLRLYKEGLFVAMDRLSSEGFTCLTLNTGRLNEGQMVNKFAQKTGLKARLSVLV